ncbi:MAG: hypothetical protein FIB08_14315 [Candidatus Methanoperedens sp.]|nr:hypothetical protein [Candidatus Methanoperedens sp.]
MTLVSLLVGIAGAIPVVEWNITYSNAGQIFDVQETRDGGYVFAVPKYSQDGGVDGYYLIKTDALGYEQWRKPSENVTSLHNIEKTKDGGYILIGSRSIYGDFGSKDFPVAIKVDASGNEEWNRSFDENIDKFDLVRGGFNSVQQTRDGGYILAETASRDSSYYARVIKLDSGGDMEWFRKFEKSFQALVFETQDSGYLFLTSIENSTKKEQDSKLINLDASGKEIWNRTFGGKNISYISSMTLTDDGYIFAGHTYSSGTSDAWLVKTDFNGKELWVKTFGGTNDDGFRSIQKTLDGGYILAGYIGADGSNDVLPYLMGDAWLVKVDTDGNMRWDMKFGELDMVSIVSARQTRDGGYIIAGLSEDSWLMKLGNETESPVISQIENKKDIALNVWTKTYGIGYEIYSVYQTKDGGFIFAGMKYLQDSNDYHAWLMKTDASGNLQWDIFPGDDSVFLTVKEVKHGGFILGGYQSSYGMEKLDASLQETDSGGKERWKKAYSDKNKNEGISDLLEVDDGYIIPIIVDDKETVLLKTDKNGNEVWMRNYSGATSDIQQSEDRGYILAGSEYGSGTYFIGNGWIIKTDKYGNKSWNISIPEISKIAERGSLEKAQTTIKSVQETKDGGYIAVGDVNYFSSKGFQDTGIIKLDASGNVQWNRTIKGGIGQSVLSIMESPDGGYIIGGKINMYRTTGVDAMILKIDESGNELWKKTISEDGDENINSIIRTSDNGLMFAGSKKVDKDGQFKAWFMKIGNIERRDTVTNVESKEINNMSQMDAFSESDINLSNESTSIVSNKPQRSIPFSGFIEVMLSIMLIVFFKRIKR